LYSLSFKSLLYIGCTRGIGKAFAHALAQKGLNIILVSRDKELLLQESWYVCH